MKHWTEDERAEYEKAADDAWAAGKNSRERSVAWLRFLRDAEQAQKAWAIEVLDDSLRDGAWRRLKGERRSRVQHNLAFAGDVIAMPGIGGVVKKTETGREYEQLSFIDMTRDQLLAKQREYEATAFAARRNKHLVRRLIALLDSAPKAKTAREAARNKRIDIEKYLGSDAA